MITYVGSEYNVMGMTTCALRSMLPVYVATCDAKAVRCEESLLSMAVEAQACDQTMEGSAPCSADCAAFVAKVSSGSKCMESALSIHEAVAHAVQQTCGDSGKLGLFLFVFFFFASRSSKLSVTNIICREKECYVFSVSYSRDISLSFVRQCVLQKRLLAQECNHSELQVQS
jgi:hypothetical protein